MVWLYPASLTGLFVIIFYILYASARLDYDFPGICPECLVISTTLSPILYIAQICHDAYYRPTIALSTKDKKVNDIIQK